MTCLLPAGGHRQVQLGPEEDKVIVQAAEMFVPLLDGPCKVAMAEFDRVSVET